MAALIRALSACFTPWVAQWFNPARELFLQQKDHHFFGDPTTRVIVRLSRDGQSAQGGSTPHSRRGAGATPSNTAKLGNGLDGGKSLLLARCIRRERVLIEHLDR